MPSGSLPSRDGSKNYFAESWLITDRNSNAWYLPLSRGVLLVLAWLATAVVRIAQGSATVAMITRVGLMSAVIDDGSVLDYHPLYLFLAIGFGFITLSLMNDSGFWVVQRLSGFTEKETLKTWSVLLTAIAVLGLAQTLVFSKILPLKAKAEETREQAALVANR
jgi:hypothetical protein